MVRCREEADAKAALQALREARVLHSSDVPEHVRGAPPAVPAPRAGPHRCCRRGQRVLFATTERGHCAIARQVAPSCVVDSELARAPWRDPSSPRPHVAALRAPADPEVIRYMAPHTSRCVLLSSGPAVADLPALRWASLLELATEGESR